MASFFKKLIYNQSFIDLYPMVEKGQTLCDQINSCDYDNDARLAANIEELYSFVISDAAITDINSDSTQRQLNSYYRQKRIKIKDEETNKKVVEKITVQRKGIGFKKDIEQYNKKISNIKTEAIQLECLASSLESCSLEPEQLILCDSVLKNNRINPIIYKIGMAILILLIILAITSMIF